MRWLALLSFFLCSSGLQAQWTLQDSHTTADLRGIDYVGNRVAWASGTDGTILRTETMGDAWEVCPKPAGGEHLDFRAVQALDSSTAFVMSSGKGELSRVFETTDGCQTWTLIFTNPDKDGFFDAMIVSTAHSPKTEPSRQRGSIDILGDPVDKKFALWHCSFPCDKNAKFKRDPVLPRSGKDEAAFAASNSSMFLGLPPAGLAFATGSEEGSHWMWLGPTYGDGDPPVWSFSRIPVGSTLASSGVFSVVFDLKSQSRKDVFNVVTPQSGIKGIAVGGDYVKPEDGSASAAYTSDGGIHWETPAADAMPGGYRSAVAYDEKTHTWITVGPNGTDISTDDGHHWHPLKPTAADAADADQHWNALSLPFVVGPHGRIGKPRDFYFTR